MRFLRYGSTMPFVSRPPKFLGPFPAPAGDMIQAAEHQLCCLQQTLPIHLARVILFFCGCAISSSTYWSLEAKRLSPTLNKKHEQGRGFVNEGTNCIVHDLYSSCFIAGNSAADLLGKCSNAAEVSSLFLKFSRNHQK